MKCNVSQSSHTGDVKALCADNCAGVVTRVIPKTGVFENVLPQASAQLSP